MAEAVARPIRMDCEPQRAVPIRRWLGDHAQSLHVAPVHEVPACLRRGVRRFATPLHRSLRSKAGMMHARRRMKEVIARESTV